MCSPFTESVELGFVEATNDLLFGVDSSRVPLCALGSAIKMVSLSASMLKPAFGLIPDKLVGVQEPG